MPCNAQSAKAADPNYACNERTHRWNLRRRLEAAADPNRGRRRAPAAADGLGALTVRALLALPQARSILNRTRMRKAELVTAIQIQRQRRRHQAAQGEAPTPPAVPPAAAPVPPDSFRQACKEWEERCPMETTLEGDPWCSFENDHGLIRFPDWSFCTTVDEAVSMLNSALTTYDYMIGAARLNLPNNPYNRQLIPLPLYHVLYTKIHQLPNARRAEIAKEFPAAAMFLHNLRAPGLRSVIDPAAWNLRTPVQKSAYLMDFLTTKTVRPRGQAALYRLTHRTDHANHRIVWSWVRGRTPPNF